MRILLWSTNKLVIYQKSSSGNLENKKASSLSGRCASHFYYLHRAPAGGDVFILFVKDVY